MKRVRPLPKRDNRAARRFAQSGNPVARGEAMFDRETSASRNSPYPNVASRAARCLRAAALAGALLAVSACSGGFGGVTLPDDAPGGSCTGVAGMTVPNCDFSRPPAY